MSAYWNNLKPWLLARAGEKSTWLGIATLASTLFGFVLLPSQATAIATMGTVAASMIAVATKEAPKE